MPKITLFVIVLITASLDAKYTFVTPGIVTSGAPKPTTTVQTTTNLPTPTSILPVTTTVKPPIPIYHVNDSREVCILMSADISIVIQYADNKSKEADVKNIGNVSGECGSPTQYIKLSFFKDWTLKFVFEETDKNTYYTSEVELKYDTETFPDKLSYSATSTVMINNLTDYGNMDGQEYVCDDGIKMSGSLSSSWNGTITAFIKNIKLEAFRHNITTLNFNTNGVKNCSASDTNTLIPIIVGSVLIILIIIVLVAYLISRRTRRTGYESV